MTLPDASSFGRSSTNGAAKGPSLPGDGDNSGDLPTPSGKCFSIRRIPACMYGSIKSIFLFIIEKIKAIWNACTSCFRKDKATATAAINRPRSLPSGDSNQTLKDRFTLKRTFHSHNTPSPSSSSPEDPLAESMTDTYQDALESNAIGRLSEAISLLLNKSIRESIIPTGENSLRKEILDNLVKNIEPILGILLTFQREGNTCPLSTFCQCLNQIIFNCRRIVKEDISLEGIQKELENATKGRWLEKIPEEERASFFEEMIEKYQDKPEAPLYFDLIHFYLTAEETTLITPLNLEEAQKLYACFKHLKKDILNKIIDVQIKNLQPILSIYMEAEEGKNPLEEKINALANSNLDLILPSLVNSLTTLFYTFEENYHLFFDKDLVRAMNTHLSHQNTVFTDTPETVATFITQKLLSLLGLENPDTLVTHLKKIQYDEASQELIQSLDAFIITGANICSIALPETTQDMGPIEYLLHNFIQGQIANGASSRNDLEKTIINLLKNILETTMQRHYTDKLFASSIFPNALNSLMDLHFQYFLAPTDLDSKVYTSSFSYAQTLAKNSSLAIFEAFLKGTNEKESKESLRLFLLDKMYESLEKAGLVAASPETDILMSRLAIQSHETIDQFNIQTYIENCYQAIVQSKDFQTDLHTLIAKKEKAKQEVNVEKEFQTLLQAKIKLLLPLENTSSLQPLLDEKLRSITQKYVAEFSNFKTSYATKSASQTLPLFFEQKREKPAPDTSLIYYDLVKNILSYADPNVAFKSLLDYYKHSINTTILSMLKSFRESPEKTFNQITSFLNRKIAQIAFKTNLVKTKNLFNTYIHATEVVDQITALKNFTDALKEIKTTSPNPAEQEIYERLSYLASFITSSFLRGSERTPIKPNCTDCIEQIHSILGTTELDEYFKTFEKEEPTFLAEKKKSDNFHAQIGEYQDKIERYKENIRYLQAELETTDKEITEDLEARLLAEKQQTQEKKGFLDTCLAKDYKADLEDCVAKKTALEDAKTALLNSDAYKNRLSSEENTLNDFQAEIDKYSSDITEYETIIVDLNQKMKLQEKETHRLEALVQDQEKKVLEVEEKLLLHKASIEEKEKNIAVYSQKKEAIATQIEALSHTEEYQKTASLFPLLDTQFTTTTTNLNKNLQKKLDQEITLISKVAFSFITLKEPKGLALSLGKWLVLPNEFQSVNGLSSLITRVYEKIFKENDAKNMRLIQSISQVIFGKLEEFKSKN